MGIPGTMKLGTVLILCFSWSLLLTGADSQITDPVEVNALRSIRSTLNDPNGHLVRWDRGDPCTSNWTGILCYNGTFNDGYLHIRHLFLIRRNLSGTLSPELGRLSRLVILDFMWNNISGSIPREIGNITTLQLLLLNGNNLTGFLPDELGNLSNLDRIQIDQNHISGPIPLSFANLTAVKHFHMNNNSLSGQIPPEISRLPKLVHILLDNNNLSGFLPPELAETQNLLILQLDNNNFSGSTIPSSYGNMSHLLKLSLRNCSLQGPVPRWINLPQVAYIDLSLNQLSGSIPTETLSENITTFDLSINNLNGTLPASFSSLPHLQRLSVANNSLSGSIPAILWQNRTLNSTERLLMDFGYNMFVNISGSFSIAPNVTIGLQGNPVCVSNNLLLPYCGTHEETFDNGVNVTSLNDCPANTCPPDYEYAPATPLVRCFCSAPLYIGYRLKSPGFSDFIPYLNAFIVYLSSGLEMSVSQLEIDSVAWQEGPRLRMYLKLFPPNFNSSVRLFNRSEYIRIRDMFGGWTIPDSDIFGPYELINLTLTETYRRELDIFPSSGGLSKGALAGIILGVIAGSVALSAVVFLLVLKRYKKKHRTSSKKRASKRISMKVDGVKDFTYREMAAATNDFTDSSVVGEGGYGKVYRGILANGTVVAIKRAQEGSLQGEREFLTEIELLSRLHHRNLVALVGYCDEEGEQMLVYEYMPNGTLRDNLSGKCKVSLNFAMRVKLALASAKGILYLHTEADPPIFHRDIKASNILLDANYTAKVADFGLSKLAPVPVLEGDIPSHVSTVVKGTPGYLDPEYFLTHKLTDKSDVYSLGVVFLELLTGRHPIQHGKNIVREVNNAHRMGMIFSVVDEQMGSYPSECVEKFIDLALKCCQDETDSRPSMAEVVRELENIWSMMPDNNTKITEFIATAPGKVMSPPSSSTSSSYMKNMYASQDLSGSDLVSGAIPTVTPR